MEFTGKITFKGEKQFVWANSTPKLTVVLEENNAKEIKDSLVVDFLNDQKVALVENYREGDVITVSFNSRASEYNGKYYQNHNWRKVSKDGDWGYSAGNGTPRKSNEDMDIPF